ncbi:alpha-L-fucosidase [Massilia sp. PDC64]|nr:alpha-L-fucosidase [Massilia sp. PDC64]SDD44661.1 alpha-L-fucosidase [Massilia sp. PDC64]
MKRRQVLGGLAATLPGFAAAALLPRPALAAAARGPFRADWDSLAAYRTPDWFRNAKFGIWAHWGPQCEPEFGDWYARNMYKEGSNQYRYHLQKYGHPSTFGFKDVIRQWRAEQWDPDALLALYRKAGARYFVALANHHDNFDLYDSRFQPGWNSTRIGPKKDLIAGWAKAVRAQGLRFGVSVHAAHAWTWYEVAQGADKAGPYAGVPYDGVLTAADGKGQWWEGLDPQALYAQGHPLSRKTGTPADWGVQWNWGGGAALPPQRYVENFYDRTVDLIDKYDPDLVYFDDTALPFWPFSDAGLRIVAHMYNRSIATRGRLDAVINGKMLDERQRRSLVWDIERGQTDAIEPLPWQTCTCIGGWHYSRPEYERGAYKSAQTVVHMLVDIVSKNGNLLLSVPVRGNGTIDEKEQAIVEEIGRWMAVHGEAIYDTRPWAVFGEGPAQQRTVPLTDQGMNEGKNAPLTAADVRFTAKGDAVYAFVMGWPAGREVAIAAMGARAGHLKKPVARVEFVGTGQALAFRQAADGLKVTLPATAPALPYAFALKVLT